DLPMRMESDAIENADGPGPYGAKGMSEGALLPVAPAVAAAVFDATGVAVRELPLSPERVWKALHPSPARPIAPAEATPRWRSPTRSRRLIRRHSRQREPWPG